MDVQASGDKSGGDWKPGRQDGLDVGRKIKKDNQAYFLSWVDS